MPSATPSRPTYGAQVLRPWPRWRRACGTTSAAPLPVRCGLTIEAREARDADDACARAERLGGVQRVLQLAARGQEDERERRGLLLGDVAALEHAFAARLGRDLVEQRHGLAREREQRGAVAAVERGDEGARGLLGVRRADHVEVRDDAERRDGLDRLVRRSVFADADAVVREDVDDRQVAERGEADRGAAVVGEDQERGAARAEDAVRRDAVQDRAHAVLADAEADVAPGAVSGLEVVVAGLEVADVVERRAVEIGAAADEQRVLLGQRLEHVLAGLARRDLGVGGELRNRGEHGCCVGCLRLGRRQRWCVRGCRVRPSSSASSGFSPPRFELLRPLRVLGVELFVVFGEVGAHLGGDVEVLPGRPSSLRAASTNLAPPSPCAFACRRPPGCPCRSGSWR